MTQVTKTTDFTSYHVVNCMGVHEASCKTMTGARLMAKGLIEANPELAPMTIHRSEAQAIERRYHRSGTVYHPQDARTRRERRERRERRAALQGVL